MLIPTRRPLKSEGPRVMNIRCIPDYNPEPSTSEKQSMIAPNQYWIIRSYVTCQDPWGCKYLGPVYILDVKDGWVRYKLGDGMFMDERDPVDFFVASYQPCHPE
jgi:hypothetical protein